jgi:hypothetical protein
MSLIVDSITYNIPVIGIKRKADFLSKYAERTVDGKLHTELIGVYYNYQLQIGYTTDTDEYTALWDKLTEPTEFHTVTVPDESGDYTFTAYFSNIGDELYKITGEKNYWTGLTVNFIAQSPARTP